MQNKLKNSSNKKYRSHTGTTYTEILHCMKSIIVYYGVQETYQDQSFITTRCVCEAKPKSDKIFKSYILTPPNPRGMWSQWNVSNPNV